MHRMTTPQIPTAPLRRLVGWTGMALFAAAIAACASPPDVTTSPANSAPTTLVPTSVAPTTSVPPATAPLTTPSTTTTLATQRSTSVTDDLVVVNGARLH